MRRLIVALGALVLLASAVAISPPVVAYFFTSDGVIDEWKPLLILWSASTLFLLAAVTAIALSRTRWSRALTVVLTPIIVLLPSLGYYAWRSNPNVHHWDDPLAPSEALKAMSAPPGFRVELVAAEPMIVNPLAMTFDEKGRVWICESVDYPDLNPPVPRDRIKVLEDTDGDGSLDRSTIFADGLSLPAGVAVGFGGVWVASAPDILFLRDSDGDGKADQRDVIVTGFGKDDAHEVVNSLTWGPDGWLYGLNGILNSSRVTHDGVTDVFSCALFRIDPRTRRFELFAKGTSNPRGVIFNEAGDAFVIACVIDHLWHFAQGGHYQQQAGHYPPLTYVQQSIVQHKHQREAYSGIELYDSDVYPQEYRGKLFLGNIHGNCLNVDVPARKGASYLATGDSDFLTANDGWFMPVAVTTGPEGFLYVLDWYDRYHCYQDALRDPAGVDRGLGRLYRIAHGSGRPMPGDLGKRSTAELINALDDPVSHVRRTAARLLSERLPLDSSAPLHQCLQSTASRRVRLAAIQILAGAGRLDTATWTRLFDDADMDVRAWAVRATTYLDYRIVSATGEAIVDPKNPTPADKQDGARSKVASIATLPSDVVQRLSNAANDREMVVRAQAAIAARWVPGIDSVQLAFSALEHPTSDETLTALAWSALLPHLSTKTDQILERLTSYRLDEQPNISRIVPLVARGVLLDPKGGAADRLSRLVSVDDPNRLNAAKALLTVLAEEGCAKGKESIEGFQKPLAPTLEKEVARGESSPLYLPSAALLALWGNGPARAALSAIFQQEQRPEATLLCADVLAALRDPELPAAMEKKLPTIPTSVTQTALLAAFRRYDDPEIATILVRLYPSLSQEAQASVIDLLCSRVAWARALIRAVDDNTIQPTSVNELSIRKLLMLKDEDLHQSASRHWPTLTEDRAQRAELVRSTLKQVQKLTGRVDRGHDVFKRHCATCHRFKGEGAAVGPDLTGNGRGSIEQLVSNILDPNLVVGSAYKAGVVVLNDGRVLTGLVTERPDAVALALPGGASEQFPRSMIEEFRLTNRSLMPEGFERNISPADFNDLITFLMKP